MRVATRRLVTAAVLALAASAQAGSLLAVPELGPLDPALRRDLQGTWSVLTMKGRDDQKLMNSIWTFRDDELTVTNGEGKTERFALRVDAGPPRALYLDPIPPSKEQGGWIVFAREGDRLTLAFRDNLSGRPESLAPAPNRIVLSLVRDKAGSTVPPDPAARQRSRQEELCGALLAAGARELLGGEIERRTANYEAPLPGLPCEFHRRGDSSATVFIMLVTAPPSTSARAMFEEQREKARKSGGKGLREESLRDFPALSETVPGGDRFSLIALCGESLVWLQVEHIPGGDNRTFLNFAERVLGKLSRSQR